MKIKVEIELDTQVEQDEEILTQLMELIENIQERLKGDKNDR